MGARWLAVVARHLARAVGREPDELESMMTGYFATDRRRVLDQLAAELGLGTPELDTCIELYRTEPRRLTVLRDAVAALELAAARRSGIVTDGGLRTQQTKVRCAGLTGGVETIVYTDQLGPGAGKPAPTASARRCVASGAKPEPPSTSPTTPPRTSPGRARSACARSRSAAATGSTTASKRRRTASRTRSSPHCSTSRPCSQRWS